MHHSHAPRIVLLVLLASGSCGDDGGELTNPCADEIPAASLPLFVPCNGAEEENQCAYGPCLLWGYCAEPCFEDDDCVSWGGVAGTCSTGAGALGGCQFACAATSDCPSLNGLQLVCGLSRLCESPEECTAPTEGPTSPTTTS